jgi:hypothetical protein
MSRRPALPLLALLSLSLLLALPTLSALAAPSPQQTAPPNTVFLLSGTPHIWIADDQGALRWAGDTRALSLRTPNWADQRTVTLEQLLSFRRADPLLSSGLVKIGDPIYLSKWETNEDRPRLFHIQSIADVELFGINATNYGAFVIDPVAWQQRYGFNPNELTKTTLTPAVPPTPTPTPTPGGTSATATPTGMQAKLASRSYVDQGGSPPSYRVNTVVEVTGAPPRALIRVSAQVDEYRCSPSCEPGYKSSWGPIDAGVTNADGYVKFEDQHSPYSDYTYTFTAPDGKTAKIQIDNDYSIIS